MSARLGAGVDEAGRGPLAGPVVAAAVILAPASGIAGLGDSKKITPARRERLAERIMLDALAWSVAAADAAEIDSLNILNATLLAMRRAVEGLGLRPAHVRIDGNRCPQLGADRVDLTLEHVVGGDGLDPAIGAASILAKVCRDRHMLQLDMLYPDYGFAQHKGYPTAQHLDALLHVGPCPAHRRSFAPVRRALATRTGRAL